MERVQRFQGIVLKNGMRHAICLAEGSANPLTPKFSSQGLTSPNHGISKGKMMNANENIYWLRRFREELRTGNMDKLTASIEEAGVELILSPDFLALACEYNFNPVIILIATLGEANSSEPKPYKRVLAAYQWLQGQISLNDAAENCAQVTNCHKGFYLDVLNSGKNLQQLKEPGFYSVHVDDLKFAIEWLINIGNGTAVDALIRLWKKIEPTEKPWLVACRALIKKNEATTLKSEAQVLAETAKLLIDLAPDSHEKITQQIRIQWSKMAQLAQNGSMACIAAKAALSYEDNGERHYDLAKALALNGNLSESIEHMRSLLRYLLKLKDRDHHVVSEKPAHVFDIKSAEDTLITVNKLLRQKGLEPFLMSGTLLGFVREGGLLPHDKDIDLGIVGWENQYAIAEALIEAGHFSFDVSQLKGSERFLVTAFDLRNGNAIDFFLFHEKKDHLLHGINFDMGFVQNFKFSKFALEEVDFLGGKFFVPSDVDLNLTENYGDWRTPATSYIVVVESPAILRENPDVSQLLVYQEVLRTIIKDMNPMRIRRILSYLDKNNEAVFDSVMKKQLIDWCEDKEKLH